MRRSALRAWCAFLLWFAFSWGGLAVAIAQENGAVPQLPEVELANATEMPLAGRSTFWIDQTGALTVDQVEAGIGRLPWRVRRSETNRVPAGTLWITFEAVAPPGRQWYLEVQSSVNDRVQLFYRNAQGAWVTQEAGTGVPVADWALPGRLPTFALAAGNPQPVRYWLRADDSHGDFVAPLALLREDTLQHHREREEFVLGAFFGLMGLMTLAALANGIAFRDRASLVFALYLFVMGLGQLGRSGLGGQHLWPEWAAWNDAVLELWPGTAVAAGLWLVKILIDSARLSRAVDLAAWALILAILAATAVHIVIDNSATLNLVLSLTGIAFLAVLGMVLWGWRAAKEAHMGLIAVAFVPFVVLALPPLALALGLARANVLTRFGLYFAVLVQLPLLYYALNTRLMARREAELRASALTRADPLTGLPHRQALSERLDSSFAHARTQRQACALLCIRVSNLEAIGEELGRDAVDKALVVTASHLRRLSAGYDMAARLGQGEFALLLEAPTTREAATSRAQQLVASGLREVGALPGVMLRYHIAVAMLPRARLDGAATVQWALDGLDLITPEARKAIRTLDPAEEGVPAA